MHLIEACRLVCRRLLQERFSSLCMLLSLISVLLPAMLLFGLKTGFISSTRERMLSNPEALSIRHRAAMEISPEMIERIRQWPETGFVIPTTRATSSLVYLEAGQGSGEVPNPRDLTRLYDLKPTAAGDPLLTCYQVPVPVDAHQVCLGSSVAKKTGLKAWDCATLVASRRVGGMQQQQRIPVVVCGVLPPHAGNSNSIFSLIEVVDRVERYKENELGSGQGAAELPPASYRGLLLHTPQGETVDEQELRRHLNFREYITLTPEQAAEQRYTGLAAGQLLLLFSSPLGAEQAERAAEIATKQGYMATLWNPATEVTLQQTSFMLCQQAGLEAKAPAHASEAPLVYAAEALGEVMLELGRSRILCRCEAKEGVPPQRLLASPELMALLLSPTALEWDYREGLCRPRRQNYSSFRLYAGKAENLRPLLAKAQQLFPSCTADINRIDAIAKLDSNLTMLCLLVAGIGGVGGICMLALSLFHSTERRSWEYALLKTFGMKALPLAFCPLFEAILLLAFSLIISYGLFCLLSDYADYLLRHQLRPGESICVLPPESLATLVFFALGAVLLSALASAIYVLRISPSQALREH